LLGRTAFVRKGAKLNREIRYTTSRLAQQVIRSVRDGARPEEEWSVRVFMQKAEREVMPPKTRL
jgi:transcriptional/translational regulatory protein YebC/TACO1